MLSFSLTMLSAALSTALAAEPTSFVLVGDSTTANGTSIKSGGWGNGFCGSTLNHTASSLEEGTPCINTAQNSATTGSFVADGWWDISVANIKGQVGKGRRTFATIQFGHNDMKIASPESMATNLTTMVQEVRILGAEPILITSLTRRGFREDRTTVDDTLQPWADQTKLVSEQQGTYLLDLHNASVAYCEAIGEEACQRLNKIPEDDTHLNNHGAIVFGRMVADLLVAAYSDEDLPVISNTALTYNISQGIASY